MTCKNQQNECAPSSNTDQPDALDLSRENTRDLDPTPSLENHKAIGFLSNTGTGTDPLESHKATKPVLSIGPS